MFKYKRKRKSYISWWHERKYERAISNVENLMSKVEPEHPAMQGLAEAHVGLVNSLMQLKWPKSK